MLINRLGGFLLPFMALFLTRRFQLGPEGAGAMVAVYGGSSLVANLVGGLLADRVGRKATMLIGMFGGSLALVGVALARTLPEVVVALIALGLLNDVYRPASQALVADEVAPVDRVRAFTLLYWAVNVGAALAPPLGGFLAEEGFTLLFLINALTTGLCGLLILWKVPASPPPRMEDSQQEGVLRGLLAPLLDLPFLAFLAVTTLVSVVFFQFLVALPLDMASRGLTPKDYGLAVGLNGLFIVLVQPFAAPFASRFRRSHVLAMAALFTGVGFGLNTWATAWGHFAFAVVVWTVGEILFAPVNAAVVADFSPEALRGRYQGAFAMTWSVAFLVAPALGGLVLSSFGREALWLGCLAVGVLGALLQLALAPARRRRMEALGLLLARD
jgi:MFS family permease